MMPGPTGRYPLGHYLPGDQGELAAKISTDVQHKLVRIDFGTTVKWLSMTKQQALTISKMLAERADTLPD